ncbi:flavoprotein [Sorangium sp. So ce117]|uniref:flavoprotein n=1 Tax=Sorangium sp. So ce117 TaxID=3133277 RepID=UPI003F631D27
MPPLCNTLVLGITGSVAAAEAPALIRHLRRELARDVFVILSRTARKFVVPRVVALHSGHPVLSDIFDEAETMKVPHVELARRADLLLVAPATAHVLAKCAHGLCDDLLTTTIVACRAPVVFAPNMNDAMWASPVVKRNVAMLRELGHHIIEPTWGFEVADGSPSFGAMPPFDNLVKTLGDLLSRVRRAEKAG